MRNFNMMAVLALGLAVAATATPALAKNKAHPGFNARAQAIGGDLAPRGGARADALKECSEQASKLAEYTWGNESDLHYRACMAQHGQGE